MSDAKWLKLREVITYNSEHGPYYDPEGEPLDMKEIKRCFAFVWWNETGKMLTTGSTKQEVCEWLSHSGYASQVVDDHPGFEIVEYVPRETEANLKNLRYCQYGCGRVKPCADNEVWSCEECEAKQTSEARIREIREEIKSTCYFVSYDASGRMTQFQLIPKGEK